MGNMATVREALRTAQPGDIIGYGDVDPLSMQIEAALTPAWYLVETLAGEHGVALAHMIGRRFPTFVPEMRYEPALGCIDGKFVVVRGEKLPRKCQMIPGFAFVFAWMSDRNWHRLKNVPGVKRIVCYADSGHAVAFRDEAIDDLRRLEVILCPIDIPAEWRTKRSRFGWRRSRRMAAAAASERTYSAPRSWINIGNGQWIEGVEALRILDKCGAEQDLAARLGLTL